MHKQKVSLEKAKVLSLAAFFLGLGFLSINRQWWPGILLVIGVALALRQGLLGKYYDMGISLFIFGGTFFIELFENPSKYFLPVIFFTSAVFLVIKEYVDTKAREEDQKEEDLSHELEEEHPPQDKK